ncbi:hypothetical protein ACWEK5_51250 [Rhodococcus koreensis]
MALQTTPDTVNAARRLIDGIDEITEADQVFINSANTTWQTGRAVPLRRIGRRMRTELGFLSTPDPMFL